MSNWQEMYVSSFDEKPRYESPEQCLYELISFPYDVAIWLSLARWHKITLINDDARQSYRTAASLDPECAEAWSNLGGLYRLTGDYEKSAEAFCEVIRIHPEHEEGWIGLGRAYDGMGQCGSAIRAYKKALEYRADNAVVWYRLGRAHRDLGRHSEANDAHQEAARLMPGFDFDIVVRQETFVTAHNRNDWTPAIALLRAQ